MIAGRIGFVEVRDVAKAHVLALTSPTAAGKRLFVISGSAWYTDLEAMLEKKYGKGFNSATKKSFK